MQGKRGRSGEKDEEGVEREPLMEMELEDLRS